MQGLLLRQLFRVLAYCVFNQWREVFLEVRGHPRRPQGGGIRGWQRAWWAHLLVDLHHWLLEERLQDGQQVAVHVCDVQRARYRRDEPHCAVPHPHVLKNTDQFKISPAASPGILHHTVWRTWLFIAYYRLKMIITSNSHYLIYTFLFKRLGECPFWTSEWKS